MIDFQRVWNRKSSRNRQYFSPAAGTGIMTSQINTDDKWQVFFWLNTSTTPGSRDRHYVTHVSGVWMEERTGGTSHNHLLNERYLGIFEAVNERHLGILGL